MLLVNHNKKKRKVEYYKNIFMKKMNYSMKAKQ